MKKEKGRSALREFREETGLSIVNIAGLIGVPVDTMSKWLSKRREGPQHDGMLELAVAEARRRYAAKIIKAKITKDPVCPWCGDPLPITKDGRKLKSDHTCPLTGYRHILTKRAPDLAYRALTPIVRES
jgi:transcriptional regulator with XRE-family HTH domain